jgi:hypothetical protein
MMNYSARRVLAFWLLFQNLRGPLSAGRSRTDGSVRSRNFCAHGTAALLSPRFIQRAEGSLSKKFLGVASLHHPRLVSHAAGTTRTSYNAIDEVLGRNHRRRRNHWPFALPATPPARRVHSDYRSRRTRPRSFLRSRWHVSRLQSGNAPGAPGTRHRQRANVSRVRPRVANRIWAIRRPSRSGLNRFSSARTSSPMATIESAISCCAAPRT